MNNKKQGFSAKYAALILVLAVLAAGTVALLTKRSSENVQEAAVQTPAVENMAKSTQSTLASQAPSVTTASEPTSAPKASEAAQTDVQAASVEEEPAVEVSALQTMLPVSGEAIYDYAMDCLSYNETTRDWRTHNGIDLAAEAGEPVAAAADGTVYTTYEDDALGYTVVVNHPGGYTTRYSSLQEDLCVAPGDTVTMGQTLGYAGDSALVETAIGTHVHFSVSYQDAAMDPAEFLELG